MVSFENKLEMLTKEGFIYFSTAQENVHTHKDLESDYLKLDIGYGLGMYDDLKWWINENVQLFPIGSCKNYDLYAGEDGNLYGIDDVWYCLVFKVGKNIRNGLEIVSAGDLERHKELTSPARKIE